ncbi:HAD-IA family hydrolase [Paenibacillus sp. PL91]|uniref:HAD-IA family hydrolase n=1 Tax=Paenibacillus sp. PL91 TaxID=2729538 RepID=UPI00145F649F|nr:HAD-IA family hydrolase [Paenibacillus sp. PL91]MBC9199480.1 HAD-IA family hydrolase [Paenibacillus sp. PL91]
MTKPQLVLDIGGVLATNLSPLFWELLAAEANVSEEVIYAVYKKQISERLWIGDLTEEQFWLWVKDYTPLLETKRARAFIDNSLQPLPALAKVAEWSEIADVHLLSNHLPGWVEPIVKPIKPYLKSITISSLAAVRKPHPDIYARTAAYFPTGSTALFVDDKSKNIKQAASLGWRTLLADEDGKWIPQVLPLLEQVRKQE